MINNISRHSYYMETKDNGDYVVDPETGEVTTRFPTPWPHFKNELEIRLTQDAKKLRKQLFDVNYDSYAEIDLDTVNPPFVSRMSNHKVTGAAHKGTVRSGKIADQGKTISKVSLTSLKLDKEGEIVGYYNPDSDRLLYEALKVRLAAHGGDGNKAFAEGDFHKPKSDGTLGPVVKKVKVVDVASSMVDVQEHTGVADNDSMVRCDVFYVDGDGYYFVPIYVADTVAGKLPSKAPIAGKDKQTGLKKWKEMNAGDFVFSLYPNDLIRIFSKKPITVSIIREESSLAKEMTVPGEDGLFLYYKGMDISRGALEAVTHDNTYKHRSIGKTMIKIEKYEVDVLGNVRKVGKETRQTFDRRKKG
jgi:CRISPR-associated endonuclease Csn1